MEEVGELGFEVGDFGDGAAELRVESLVFRDLLRHDANQGVRPEREGLRWHVL